MIVDPGAGELCWACAGHPAPLLIDAAGARYLDQAGRRPLFGLAPVVGGRRPATDGITTVGPGTTILLYTDGLVERRDEPLDAGLARLASAAAPLAQVEPARVLSALLTTMLHDQRPQDDVAVIAARLLPADLHRRHPARSAELAGSRREAEAWARECGLPGGLVDDLQLALGEATANSAEHAYAPGAAGDFEYRLHRRPDGSISVLVKDFGTWRPEPADRGHRGRGLDLIRALATDVTVDHDPTGTTVRFTMLPQHDSAPGPEPDAAAPRTAGTAPTVTYHPEDDALRIEFLGEFDSTALGLRSELLAAVDEYSAARPGTAEVRVDLRSTAYLSSTGIGLVLEVVGHARTLGHRTRLLHTPGSAAARMLTIAGIDPP